MKVKFEAYLWGIETPATEFKFDILDWFEAYLWGIETFHVGTGRYTRT